MSSPPMLTNSSSSSFSFPGQVSSCHSCAPSLPQSPDQHYSFPASRKGSSLSFVSACSSLPSVDLQKEREATWELTGTKAGATDTGRVDVKGTVPSKGVPPSIQSGWATGEASQLVLEEWGDCGRGFVYLYRGPEKQELEIHGGKKATPVVAVETTAKQPWGREEGKKPDRGVTKKAVADVGKKSRQILRSKESDKKGDEGHQILATKKASQHEVDQCAATEDSDAGHGGGEKPGVSYRLYQRDDALDLDTDDGTIAAFEPGTKLWLDWEAMLDDGQVIHSMRRLARFTVAPWKPFPMPALYHALKLAPTIFPGLSELEDEEDENGERVDEKGPHHLVQYNNDGGESNKEYKKKPGGEERKIQTIAGERKTSNAKDGMLKREEGKDTVEGGITFRSRSPRLSLSSACAFDEDKANDTAGGDDRSSRRSSGSLTETVTPNIAVVTRRRTAREKKEARLERHLPRLAEFWVWCNYRWAYGEEGRLSSSRQPSRRALRRLIKRLRRDELRRLLPHARQQEAQGTQDGASQGNSTGVGGCPTRSEDDEARERGEDTQFLRCRPEKRDYETVEDEQDRQKSGGETDVEDAEENLTPERTLTRAKEENTCDSEALDTERTKVSSSKQGGDGDAEDGKGSKRRQAGGEEPHARDKRDHEPTQSKKAHSVQTIDETNPVQADVYWVPPRTPVWIRVIIRRIYPPVTVRRTSSHEAQVKEARRELMLGRRSYKFEAYREALARFRDVRSALRCPRRGHYPLKYQRGDLRSGLTPAQMLLRRRLLLQADVSQLMALYQLKRYDSIFELAEKIHSEYSSEEVPAKVFYLQGLAKKAQSAYEEAAAFFEAGLRKDPRNALIRSQLQECISTVSGDSPSLSVLFGSWSPTERRRRFLQVVALDSRWGDKQEQEERMAARAYHLEGLRREQKKRQDEKTQGGRRSPLRCSFPE
ncbi:hypothetical protein CSUI_003355 [Cystoisospora suis]|uniref:Uncharacterized protein n=1 Tax=Cystoisospora suis TaxID=483139 RepID=A0A2C6L2V2_9APIC|nr:hypothetical protein CSUI_003355 [Cystoisospora suis]